MNGQQCCWRPGAQRRVRPVALRQAGRLGRAHHPQPARAPSTRVLSAVPAALHPPPQQAPGWSRIGRLKRSTFPKLTGGGHAYGGGAGPGVLSTVAGRLLCDTYLSGA